MNSGDFSTFALAFVVPVVTTIVGVLGAMFQDWRENRTQERKRKSALEEARLQVSFAADWWNAESLISSSPERMAKVGTQAARLLEDASEKVASVQDSVAVRTNSVAASGDSISIRRLLLLYKLDGRSAKGFRIAFFILLAWLIIIAAYTPSYIGSKLMGGFLTESSFFALSALAARFAAVSADKSKAGKLKSSSIASPAIPDRPHNGSVPPQDLPSEDVPEVPTEDVPASG